MKIEDGSLRVLGIDPGLNITGFGAIEFRPGREPTILAAGTLRTDAGADMPTRIAQLHADLTELIQDLRPDLMAMEKLYAHYKHPRTSILMAHARGVLMLAAQQAHLRVVNLPATQVKKSLTGNGHASKSQMQHAIQSICKLPELPEPPDVADALAIALCATRDL